MVIGSKLPEVIEVAVLTSSAFSDDCTPVVGRVSMTGTLSCIPARGTLRRRVLSRNGRVVSIVSRTSPGEHRRNDAEVVGGHEVRCDAGLDFLLLIWSPLMPLRTSFIHSPDWKSSGAPLSVGCGRNLERGARLLLDLLQPLDQLLAARRARRDWWTAPGPTRSRH